MTQAPNMKTVKSTRAKVILFCSLYFKRERERETRKYRESEPKKKTGNLKQKLIEEINE